MQHHRAYTRLLDWTESALVGLYFVVYERPRDDGCLWCLLPIQLNKMANIVRPYPAELPAFEIDKELDNYLPTTIEKEKATDLNPVAAIAFRRFPRLYAQLGVFTITHRRHIPLENIGGGQHIWRLVVPRDAKLRISRELEQLRFNRLTLFPELESVAELARKVLR